MHDDGAGVAAADAADPARRVAAARRARLRIHARPVAGRGDPLRSRAGVSRVERGGRRRPESRRAGRSRAAAAAQRVRRSARSRSASCWSSAPDCSYARCSERAASIPASMPRGVELAFLDLSLSGYTETTGPAFAQQLIERVRTLPGVRDATMSAMMPLGMSRMGLGGLSLPGAPMPADRPAGPAASGWLNADWNVVEPGLLQDDEDAAGQRARLHRRRSPRCALGGDRQRDGGATDVAESGSARARC